MTSVLLEGAISAGMFPTESVVTIENSEGQEVTLVAPKSHIVERDRRHYVRVRIVGQSNGYSEVLLPGEVFDAGQTVTVKKSSLVEA